MSHGIFRFGASRDGIRSSLCALLSLLPPFGPVMPLSAGVITSSEATSLVAGVSPAERFTAGEFGALPRAVDVSAIAAAANNNESPATCTEEESVGLANRSGCGHLGVDEKGDSRDTDLRSTNRC